MVQERSEIIKIIFEGLKEVNQTLPENGQTGNQADARHEPQSQLGRMVQSRQSRHR